MAEIVQLRDDDEQLARFWDLRLDALRNAPEAFGSSYEEAVRMPLAERIALQRGRMSAQNVVFVAQEGGAFIGMTGIYREPRIKTAHLAGIWGVYVQPVQRGRGLGRALMARAIACGREWGGVAAINLAVVTSNAAALHLYEALGFVTWGTQPLALCVNGQYYAEHHMTLRVDGP